jgi:hypothetical protein
MIATFFLVLAVYGKKISGLKRIGTAIDKRAEPMVYGFCIGGTLMVSALGIGNITGAA